MDSSNSGIRKLANIPAQSKWTARGSSTSRGRPHCDTWLAASAGRQLLAINPDGTERHKFDNSPKSISALAWHPQGSCVAVSYFGGVCLWDADDFVAQKEYPYKQRYSVTRLVSRWALARLRQSGSQRSPLDPRGRDRTANERLRRQGEGTLLRSSLPSTRHWRTVTSAASGIAPAPDPKDASPPCSRTKSKICAVAFQNSHGLLASASQDGVVMVWSPERPKPLRATVKMPATATKICWSPDDQMLAIGSEQGIVYVLKCES